MLAAKIVQVIFNSIHRNKISNFESESAVLLGSSSAPSFSAMNESELQIVSQIIGDACGDTYDDTKISHDSQLNIKNNFNSTEQILENEEQFDDSDVDPDYTTESESDTSEDEIIVNKKKLKLNNENIPEVETVEHKRKGRKTTKNDTRQARHERNRKRNLGLKYVTKKGKIIKERQYKELLDCRLQCKMRISEENRKLIFKEYWAMQSFNKRIAFIASLITTEEKKCTKRKIDDIKRQKNRQVTNTFHLHIDGQLTKICKNCFLKTFDESNKFVTNVLKNKNTSTSGITHDDLRGTSSPANKTSDEDIELIRTHILSVPSYESHYSRKKSSKRYLPHHYTLSRMYDEYKKWLPQHKHAVSRFVYQKVFHSLGIKIKQPHKDTCALCDKYKLRLQAAPDAQLQEELSKELDLHQTEAENAYETKRLDKEISLVDNTKHMYTFDLQQCLPTPDIGTSVAFYKRQLWTFNLTLHRCSDKQATCFMWHEAVAARGANQIASCLYKHFTPIDENVKEITLFSDTCGGQNKNSILPVMFMLLLKKNPHITHINHKFLVPGHTHMECDGDHSIIEKKKKKYPCPIDHPRDWINLVRLCRSKKPFNVIEMSMSDFFEFSALYKTVFQHRINNTEGEKIVWRDIKWLRYSQQPGMVEYKTSLKEEGPFKVMDLRRKWTNWPKQIKIPLSYRGPNPINPEKKKNLLELLPYVSEPFHDFYRNLKTKDDVGDILPDASGGEEEEEENEVILS